MKVGNIEKACGLSAGRFSQWRHGDEVTDRAVEKILENVESEIKKRPTPYVKRLLAPLNRYRDAYRAGNIPISQMATIFGMTANDGRRIIDGLISERLPLLPAVYESAGRSDQAHRARDTLEHYAGVYTLQMKRGKTLLTGALQVRYVLQLSDGHAVRCKMHIPKLSEHLREGSLPFWEYDGFVSSRLNASYWVFGKRVEEQADFFYLITDLGEVRDGQLQLSGNYLTTGQDKMRSRISQPVMLKREQVLSANMDEFMVSALKVVDGRR